MNRQSKTVLWVSVDGSILGAVIEALGQSYLVRTAETEDAALAIISTEKVDLAIFDCSTDTQQCEFLLKSCHNLQPFCKVILVGDENLSRKMDSLTAHGWCQKPVDMTKLLTTVHSLVHDKNTAIFLDRMTDQSMKYSLTRDEDPDSHQQYARFLETFNLGVCLVDADGVVEYVNKKGCELFGVQTGEKLVGVSLYSLFKLDAERELHFLQKYVKREWTPQPLVMMRPDGTDIAIQANITYSETDPAHVVTVFFSS